MTRIERFDDPRAFFARVEGFLAAREAQHNLMLGFRRALEADPHTWGPDDPVLLAALDGERVVAAATRTPPHNLVLSEIDDPAYVDAFAERLAADGADLPGALGPKAAVARFAEVWAARTGVRPRVLIEERIYEATEIDAPRDVPGRMRPYAAADRALTLEWIGAFFEEAAPGSVEADAEEFLGRREAQGEIGLLFWEDDGEPVSLLGYGSPTPNGMRIGPVYTPPALRGHGYASALTAAASLRILERRRFCFLFTNLANPTANAIYLRVGYRPVGDVTMWVFDPA